MSNVVSNKLASFASGASTESPNNLPRCEQAQQDKTIGILLERAH
jgi:hypothetical protein